MKKPHGDDDEVFSERDIVTLNYGFMTVCDDTQLDMRCTNDDVNRIKFAGYAFYEYRGQAEAPCRF